MGSAAAAAAVEREGPERTRERLLDAAEALFSARGFRATSVRDITAEAGCNLAAVNYHFGGKVNLYPEMFHHRLAALREQRISTRRRARAAAGDRASWEIVLRAFTPAFPDPPVDESGGRPRMRLISRELLDPPLKRGTSQGERVEPVQKALTEAIRTVCRLSARE